MSKFLLACVERASGQNIAPKSKTEHVSTKETQKKIQENVVNFTSHLVKALPDLLATFANVDIIAQLVQIPQYFSLDVYAEYGLEEVHTHFSFFTF